MQKCLNSIEAYTVLVKCMKSEKEIRARMEYLRRNVCGPYDDTIEEIRALEWVLDEE